MDDLLTPPLLPASWKSLVYGAWPVPPFILAMAIMTGSVGSQCRFGSPLPGCTTAAYWLFCSGICSGFRARIALGLLAATMGLLFLM